MPGASLATARFVRGWFQGQALHDDWGKEGGSSAGDAGDGVWPPRIPGVCAETRMVTGEGGADGAPVPIRVRWYSREGAKRPLPGWLLLHGAAVQGPDHPALVRFAAALASAGAVVAIPEIPAWSRLELDPGPVGPIVERTLSCMGSDPGVRSQSVMLAGFSFGCLQAIRVAADLGATGRVRGVVGFGGYCDLESAVRFGMTGFFRQRGRRRQMRKARPDPYGRWVFGANYLHLIPGYEGAKEVSSALRELARTAGIRGVLAWEPVYDDLKARLAAPLSPDNRNLFRVFAPESGAEPDLEAAQRIAPLLANAGRLAHPLLELPPSLDAGALPPVRLVHGRDDPLVPFTETLALERRLRDLAPGVDVRATVTGLFGHAREGSSLLARPAETTRFLIALRGLMSLQSRRGR